MGERRLEDRGHDCGRWLSCEGRLPSCRYSTRDLPGRPFTLGRHSWRRRSGRHPHAKVAPRTERRGRRDDAADALPKTTVTLSRSLVIHLTDRGRIPDSRFFDLSNLPLLEEPAITPRPFVS